MKTTRSAKRTIALIAAFALSFSSILSVMTTETYAASAKAPAKVGGVAGTGSGQTYASIKWTKIKKNKNTKGYTVYRNGAAVGSVGKGTSSFTDYNLAPGRTYTYQVRAYNTYKEKRWYNKKTGQYQKKKPAKKIRGKSKKFTRYKYGKASAATYVATKARANNASPGSSSGGNTGGNTGGGTTSQWETVTSYMGNTSTIRKRSDGLWEQSVNGATYILSSRAPADRWTDGSWGSGTSAMKQVSGATFKMAGPNNTPFETPGSWNSYISFTAYNLDASKVSYTLGNGVSIQPISGYYYDSDQGKKALPVTRYYFVKNGNYLAKTYSSLSSRAGEPLVIEPDGGNKFKVSFYIATEGESGTGAGEALGLSSESISITLKYDSKTIGTFTVKPFSQTAVNGMHPRRALAYSIAKQAVGSKSGDLNQDLKTIANYIQATYNYEEAVSGSGWTEPGGIRCTLSTYILETWAIKEYGSSGLGFAGWGNSSSPSHIAFHLNSSPNNWQEVYYKDKPSM